MHRILLLHLLGMYAKKTVAEMLGEFLREAAVLLAVFIPLEAALRREAFMWWWFRATVIAAVPILAMGMIVERRRS